MLFVLVVHNRFNHTNFMQIGKKFVEVRNDPNNGVFPSASFIVCTVFSFFHSIEFIYIAITTTTVVSR